MRRTFFIFMTLLTIRNATPLIVAKHLFLSLFGWKMVKESIPQNCLYFSILATGLDQKTSKKCTIAWDCKDTKYITSKNFFAPFFSEKKRGARFCNNVDIDILPYHLHGLQVVGRYWHHQNAVVVVVGGLHFGEVGAYVVIFFGT